MSMKAPTAPSGTASAPLVYWLLLVCGLAAVTALRIGDPSTVMPLWAGSVLGVALGQLLAYWRLRIWLTLLILIEVMFVVAFALTMLPNLMSSEACLLAVMPAAIGGYLSMSDRGALMAFWYPAVFWMMAILERPIDDLGRPAAFALVCGLAALFVAFVRARETRRVLLWQTHVRPPSQTSSATPRLAMAHPRTVLRHAPLRSLSLALWTGLLAGGTVVLTTWILPFLLHKEPGKGDHSPPANAAQLAAGSQTGAAPVCCPVWDEPKATRVKEYFPLSKSKETPSPVSSACVPCQHGQPLPTAAAPHGSGEVESLSSYPSLSPGAAPAGQALPPPVALLDLPPTVPAVQPAAKPKLPVAPKGAPVAPNAVQAPAPAVAMVEVQKPAPPPDSGRPWQSFLAVCLVASLIHVGARALRRQLTVRHLLRPFWPETIDQRVSNHWQLMLIGLRDAGWQSVPGEQPSELARRVGIEGVAACAKVLDRARHGVRVDADDLAVMESAAWSVYRVARDRAGLAARAVATVRWPLI